MNLRSMPRLLTAICCSLILFACNQTSKESDANSGNATGVNDSEIVIGSFGPLTGPAALWGNIIKGTDAYFKMINEAGGIHNRQIKFVYKDDEYNPSKTVPAIRELIQQDEVFAIAGGIGTATSMSASTFIEENSIPWICPMSGAAYWSQPAKDHIYTVFPLYVDEGQIMAEYAIETLGAKKLGVIYVNDDFGKSGLAGVQHKLEENDLEFVASLPVEPTDSDLSSHVARLQESGAEVVFLWVTPRHAAIVLGTSAVMGYQPQWMSSLVLSDMALMHNITKGAWEGVYFTYMSETMATDTTNPTFLKYKDAFHKYYPEERWGTFAAIGFMFFEPMVAALEKAGRDLTRESFLEAMGSLQNFKLTGGVNISLSPDQHLGTRSLIIMRCKSATEAEKMTDLISSSGDVSSILAEMHDL